ncbi:MAG: hypothetical protein COA90_03520 [Gammaproteobacteria bacterium]|nr:MAG: hypothetical protein COA90_03520 [Gammaproteobacteria bacterium]
MDNLFFIVSKIVWGLLSPTNLIILLMALGTLLLLLNKVRLAKWLLVPTTIISLGLLSYPFGDILIEPLENRFSKPTTLPETIDGIIILGGGERLKISVERHTAEVGDGGDRFIAGAILAKHYPDSPVIFSGGSGLLQFQSDRTAGDIAKDLLLAIGIDESRLIIEDKSRNTYENFVKLKSVLPKVNGRYLLVTSAFHMPRSMGIAQQQGVNVIAYPVDFQGSLAASRQFDFSLFDHLHTLELAWREWIGLTVYYWTGKTASWYPDTN